MIKTLALENHVENENIIILLIQIRALNITYEILLMSWCETLAMYELLLSEIYFILHFR